MITREQVAAAAQSWAGTPWVHQASLKGVGCDCIGLVSGVAAELGIPEAHAWRSDVRFKGYGRLPLPDKLLEACSCYLDRIPVVQSGLGDILLFTFLKDPMHFALISRTHPLYIAHAYSPNKRIIEHILDDKWMRQFVGAFRYKGVQWPH